MDANPRDRVRALAAGQDGQFALRQAGEHGLSRDQVRGWRRSGEVIAIARGVCRFAAAPGHADPDVTAYLLCWPYGVISHASAARFHGLTRVRAPDEPHVVVPFPRRRAPAGVAVHVTRTLPRADVLQVGGLRYTSLARTLCDLADASDPCGTLSLLDDAVALGARPRWIHQRAALLAQGRDGVSLLRAVTADDAAGAFRSWLERAAAHVYRAASLPDPEWNVPIRDDAGLIGVVDALWKRWFVISEKEGLRFHTTPRQRQEDAGRFNRLCECGYAPRRFTWADVVHRPVEVAATVLRALRVAGADLDPARVPRQIQIPRMPFLR